MNTQNLTLDVLAQMRLDAKKIEDDAIANRRDIDAAISARVTGSNEGTTTVTLDAFKVSVTRKITRTADTSKLQAEWDQLDDELRSAFRWKAEINAPQAKALDPKKLAPYMTSKQAADSIEIKALAPATN